MDVIKFNNPTAKTKMEDAELIEGLTTKMWVERYATAGEFKFTAPASLDMRTRLPEGCFVSHVNSDEVMIVENHEINESADKDPTITISGRSFESFFENRIVGSNKALPATGLVADYILEEEYPWNQVVALINDHIQASSLLDDNYAVPYVSVMCSIPGSGTPVARPIKRGTVYERAIELLKPEKLGIQAIRPGASSPIPGTPNVVIVIHKGSDKTKSVMFSYGKGEIINADYLWTIKGLKNCALVASKWMEVVVNPIELAIEYDRRMTFVDASDVDKDFPDTAPPTEEEYATLQTTLEQIGMDVIASQNKIALTKAEASKQGTIAVYRKDFNIGDLVTVSGDYNEVTTMRVSEYVEIEDENGETKYPTLTID